MQAQALDQHAPALLSLGAGLCRGAGVGGDLAAPARLVQRPALLARQRLPRLLAEPGPALRGGPITEVERGFWSFQPVRDPKPPHADGLGVRNDIDRFVQNRLKLAGLDTAPEADRRTLIRRATFDLTGLPPTPADVRAFVSDKKPGAFRRVVDRLLESPQYGVRWGRHWLDVVR